MSMKPVMEHFSAPGAGEPGRRVTSSIVNYISYGRMGRKPWLRLWGVSDRINEEVYL